MTITGAGDPTFVIETPGTVLQMTNAAPAHPDCHLVTARAGARSGEQN